MKSFLLIYISYAKCFISFGLLLNGKVHKCDLETIRQAHRCIRKAGCFMKKSENLKDAYKQGKILTVYEMFIYETFREIFIRLQSITPLNFRKEVKNQNRYFTRRSSKRLRHITSCGTGTKRKSLTDTLRKGFTCLNISF